MHKIQAHRLIIDSLRFNKDRISVLACLSTFLVLLLAAVGVDTIPLKVLYDAYAAGIGGKAAFGILLVFCLMIFGLLYAGVALVWLAILQILFYSAENSLASGDLNSALLRYQTCQRLSYLAVSENADISYQLQQRIHHIHSLLVCESKITQL